MKRIWCLILVTVLSFGVLGCSSSIQQEEKTYDEELIKSLATGLELLNGDGYLDRER